MLEICQMMNFYAYTEGMSDDEAATIHESAQESNEYMKFLRGQVEARAKDRAVIIKLIKISK